MRILYQLSHKGSPRIPEWVACPFSSRSSGPRNQTGLSCIASRFFTNWAIRKAQLEKLKWMILFKTQFFMVCMLIKKNNYPHLSVVSNLACHFLAFLIAKPSQSKHQHPIRVVLWCLPIMQHYYSLPWTNQNAKANPTVMASIHTLHSFLLLDVHSIQAQVYAPQQSLLFLRLFF